MTNLPVPDMLAAELTQEAQTQGVSVEDLLTQMLRERQRSQKRSKRKLPTGSDLIEQINKVCESESLTYDPALMRAQLTSLGKQEW